MSKYRKKIPQRQSEKYFTKYALKTHSKNRISTPQRGGIRL